MTLEEAKETLRDLKTGIIFVTILLIAAGIAFVPGRMAFCLGVLLGGGVAFFLSIHMYNSIEMALDMDSESAKKFTQKKTGIRMLIMGMAVLAACIFPVYLNVFGVAAGLLGLKLSAYMQPFIHKYIAPKIFRKGR